VETNTFVQYTKAQNIILYRKIAVATGTSQYFGTTESNVYDSNDFSTPNKNIRMANAAIISAGRCECRNKSASMSYPVRSSSSVWRVKTNRVSTFTDHTQFQSVQVNGFRQTGVLRVFSDDIGKYVLYTVYTLRRWTLGTEKE